MAIKRNSPHIRMISLLLAAALTAWGGVAAVPACADTSNWVWSRGGILSHRRVAPTANLVNLEGNIRKMGVMLVGGGNETIDPANPWNKEFNTLPYCDFYPLAQKEKIIELRKLRQSRVLHTATLLKKGKNAGKVLVVAGLSRTASLSLLFLWLPGSLNTCELFDLKKPDGNWTAEECFSNDDSRFAHTATLLSDNATVLIAGGIHFEVKIDSVFPLPKASGSLKTLSSTLLYTESGTWILKSPLKQSRALHTATLLPDGRVLVTGGVQFDKEFEIDLLNCPTLTTDPQKCFEMKNKDYQVLNSSEIYNPATGQWDNATALAGPLTHHRYFHTTTLIPNPKTNDYKILVAGGQDLSGNSTIVDRSCEIYDSKQKAWTFKPDRKGLPIPSSQHTATLLQDGNVLFVGGSVEPYAGQIYNPNKDSWALTYDFLWYPRFWHTATLLPPNGKVLVAGGLPSQCETYEPPSGSALMRRPIPERAKAWLLDD
jgi:hypothetical protein